MPLRFRPEVLEQLRLDAGLSQGELADKAGVARISVYNAETGKSAQPQARIVYKLAIVLGVPASDFYDTDEVA